MPSLLLWSLFLLWLVVTSAMLLMMLPGSAIACHIILLFIAIIATVLAYCGYLTVLVKAATIANLSHAIYTVVKCMLLAKDWLPDHDDLIIIQNLPSTHRQITLLTECMASEDLGYNILHHVNSLANDLIRPTIPHPMSAPAPGLAVLLLPPQVEFALSHIWNEPLDCPHLETYDALLKPLVRPAGISHDVKLLTLTWSMGSYHSMPFPYAKDGPNHEP